jgi:adenylosuccinate lyase
VIERYEDGFLARLFSRDREIWRWAAVERAVLHAQADVGLIPREWATAADAARVPKAREVEILERVTRHEVVAFLSEWGVQRVHIGLTSSDVTDTAMAVAVREANHHIDGLLSSCLASWARVAVNEWGTGRVGRTHGVEATWSRWGYRIADLVLALARAQTRLAAAALDARVATISGPLGDHAHRAVSREVAQRAASRLGLQADTTSSQIAHRDRLAAVGQALALVATCAEALAVQIRLAVSWDQAQVVPPSGYVGSSAMAGKVNPISGERVCGLARLVRSNADVLMDSVVQWGDRDLSSTSAERVAVPDLYHATATLLRTLTGWAEQIDLADEPMNDRHRDWLAQTEAQLLGVPRRDARHARLTGDALASFDTEMARAAMVALANTTEETQ